MDVCDEITWMGTKEASPMVSLLKRLSDVVGHVELAKLQLKEKDRKTLSDMIAAIGLP